MANRDDMPSDSRKLFVEIRFQRNATKINQGNRDATVNYSSAIGLCHFEIGGRELFRPTLRLVLLRQGQGQPSLLLENFFEQPACFGPTGFDRCSRKG